MVGTPDQGILRVKRLHIVGKSKDNKRLLLAQKKGAKFGSFEIPIGQKLLRLVEEVQEARAEKKRPAQQAPPANQNDATSVRVLTPQPSDLPEAGPQPPVAPREEQGGRVPAAAARRPLRLTGDDIDIPVEPTADAGRALAAVPEPEALFEPPPPAPAPAPEPPPEQEVEAPVVRSSRPEPKRQRPQIPARSKLSPAEIQGLIRAGRGVRSVANLAGTPVAWVKYLAEPIQQERLGVVQQMLAARQERTRLGPSSASIGDSILANLRSRGIRNPEAVFENGFNAHRPDGREWRVRLVFDHRGNRYSANWSWDPATRAVTPLNSLATQLGWRRQPGLDDEAEPRPRRRAPVKSRSSRSTSRRKKTSTRKTTTRKSSTRRTAAARKKTSTAKRKRSARR
jgi:hypothetical protein